MTGPVKNLWTTIVLGVVFASAFIPFYLVFSFFFTGKTAFYLCLWTILAVFSFYLVKVAKKGGGKIIIPLGIALGFVWLSPGIFAYLFLLLGVLGWIRSGICYEKPVMSGILIEIVLLGGSMGLISLFSPGRLVSVAFSILLFFLFQSLYIHADEEAGDAAWEEPPGQDGFETARRGAVEILSSHL